MIDSPSAATDAASSPPTTRFTPRNPYAVALWILTGALFMTAAILQRVGAEKSWVPHGTGYNESFTFDPSVLSTYNFAAFTFVVLGVLCLLATLLLHAARWKPAAS